jgi:hypothetical protein
VTPAASQTGSHLGYVSMSRGHGSNTVRVVADGLDPCIPAEGDSSCVGAVDNPANTPIVAAAYLAG